MPVWAEQRQQASKSYSRPFFLVKRGKTTYLLARKEISQVFPVDRSGPLIPSKCQGKWYRIRDTRDATRLEKLDNLLSNLFARIAQGKGSALEKETAAYIRQALDRFLNGLHAPHNRPPVPINKAIPLNEITDDILLNTIRNMEEGRPFNRNVKWISGTRYVAEPDDESGASGDEEGGTNEAHRPTSNTPTSGNAYTSRLRPSTTRQVLRPNVTKGPPARQVPDARNTPPSVPSPSWSLIPHPPVLADEMQSRPEADLDDSDVEVLWLKTVPGGASAGCRATDETLCALHSKSI